MLAEELRRRERLIVGLFDQGSLKDGLFVGLRTIPGVQDVSVGQCDRGATPSASTQIKINRGQNRIGALLTISAREVIHVKGPEQI